MCDEPRKINNKRAPEWESTRQGAPYKPPQRPAFLRGTLAPELYAEPLPKSKRFAPLEEIERPGFRSSAILPRTIPDVNKIQLLELGQTGSKVDFSDAALRKLFDVEVPDVRDVKWIAAKDAMVARLKAQGLNPQQIKEELKANKPLGRQQRTITKRLNIASSALSTSNKLKELAEEVKEGRAESRAQQAIITGQLATSVADINNIIKLTQEEMKELADTIQRLNIPVKPEQLGFDAKIVDSSFYRANSGLINVYLINEASKVNHPDYNINKPVLDFARQNDGRPAITLRKMDEQMAKQDIEQRRFLDLTNNTVLTFDQIETIANLQPGGFGSPVFNVTL